MWTRVGGDSWSRRYLRSNAPFSMKESFYYLRSNAPFRWRNLFPDGVAFFHYVQIPFFHWWGSVFSLCPDSIWAENPREFLSFSRKSWFRCRKPTVLRDENCRFSSLKAPILVRVFHRWFRVFFIRVLWDLIGDDGEWVMGDGEWRLSHDILGWAIKPYGSYVL